MFGHPHNIYNTKYYRHNFTIPHTTDTFSQSHILQTQFHNPTVCVNTGKLVYVHNINHLKSDSQTIVEL